MASKNLLEKIVDGAITAIEYLLAFGLIIAIVLDFINVMGRYTGGFTLLGAQEIQIDLLICIAFLGAAAISWRRQHLRMDVLYNLCTPLQRKIVAAFEQVVTLIVTGFVAMESVAYVQKLYAIGMVSNIMRIPMWIPHMAVAICFAAMAFITIFRSVQLAVRWRSIKK